MKNFDVHFISDDTVDSKSSALAEEKKLMERFNVRFISDDIIDGKPLATVVVTCDDLYLATFRYNYFTGGFKDLDYVPFDPIILKLFGDKCNYGYLLGVMHECAKSHILNR